MFVKDAVGNPVDFAIVKSTNDRGHGSGKQTIVEFVENEALVKKLQEIGVVYAQGYGIGSHDRSRRWQRRCCVDVPSAEAPQQAPGATPLRSHGVRPDWRRFALTGHRRAFPVSG